MQRLLVAIEIPGAIADEISPLCVGLPGAEWVQQSALLLTLRFIGDVDGGQFDDIRIGLTRVKSPRFEIQLAGLGHFGPARGPTSLWIGARKSEPLAILQGRVESRLRESGLAPETRKFTPHVKVARLFGAPAGRLANYLTHNGHFRSAPFEVSEFHLFSAQHGETWGEYLPEESYPLP